MHPSPDDNPRFTRVFPVAHRVFRDGAGSPPTGRWADACGVRTVRRMRKATTPLPTANLDELTWTIKHIATLMHIRESAARAIARRPAFPAPLCGNTTYRVWLASEVMDYVTAPRPPRQRRRRDPLAAPQVRTSIRGRR